MDVDRPQTPDYAIHGAAFARDTRLLIAGHMGFPRPVTRTADVEKGSGVFIAETDTPELAAWIADAINAVLDGVILGRPRPAGHITAAGRFREARDLPGRIFAERARSGILIAVARDPATTRALIRQLNDVLRECEWWATNGTPTHP